MLHGFFFVAVFSVSRRLFRLYHCVSNCFYAFTHLLIRQSDNTVYHSQFTMQKLPVSFLRSVEIHNIQPCIKHYNHQVL